MAQSGLHAYSCERLPRIEQNSFQRMVEDRRFLLAETDPAVRIELAKRGIDLR